ncbi:MAG: 50S ribosomal protein L9 [Phycisphaeraceae bacterium]|nr:50S ribosomal protein L9 [Phycisphaeraceae bacterium]
MARNLELLLTRTIEHLGIVGDIVRVRPGYARNYLLPLGIAEPPTKSKIEALKEARAKAQAEVAALRAGREALLSRMEDVRITLTRACNANGLLYGSVTQRDLADGLQAAGYDVGIRSVRLAAAIRRVGEYHVPVQFDRDLRTEITVVIEPDQPLEEREEMEIDDEGELVRPDRKKRKAAREARAPGGTEAPAEA